MHLVPISTLCIMNVYPIFITNTIDATTILAVYSIDTTS